MNKITKRLLSILAVLALVLTMAPAGILAVETKADSQITPGQANLPEGIAAKQAAGQAKQEAAKAALAALESEGAEARLAELNTELTTCPFCNQAATWQLANTSTQLGSATGEHYYAYGAITKGFEAWNMAADGDKACILLDEGAVVSITGRIKMYTPNNVVNVGGLGTITSSLTADSDSNVVGLFHMAAANGTLNLYGGTFLSTREAIYNRPIVYMGTTTSNVNIWTNDVVIGHETPVTTARFNIRQNGGVLNIYGGTIQNGYCNVNYSGWNLYMSAGVTNMYGGTICGGKSVSHGRGANVLLDGAATFNMYGGEVSDGTVTGTYAMGGNISSMAKSSAVINLQGGVVKNGSAPNGGNINVKLGTLTVGEKAAVIGGWAKGTYAATNDYTKNPGGGNIYIYNGTLTVNGTVSGGRADTFGGNILAMTGSTVTINGTIERGTLNPNVPVYSATDSNKYSAVYMGGAIWARECTLTINSTAKITGATARMYGGNIYLKEMVAANIGGEISGGYSLNGGNIVVESGVATISGTVKDGTAEYGGNLMLMEGNKYSYPATNTTDAAKAYNVVISGNMLGGAMTSGAIYAKNIIASNTFGKSSTITFSGAAKVELGFYIVPSIKLILAEGWTGTGSVCTEAVLTAGDKIPTNEIVYQGAYTGELTSINGDEAVLVTTDEAGQLALPGYIVVGEETSVGYANAADAVAAYQEGEYLVAAGDVTIAGDMIIDPVADITVSGSGKVYGIDRDNNSYDAWSGSITADGAEIAKDATFGGKHYIAITGGDNGEKYTFHRVETELTNVTVNVDKAGLYYKAQYKFDEIVKDRVVSYGILLNLNEAPTEESLATSSNDLSGYADTTLTASSHGVYGIFKDGKDSNLADGKTKVFGNPYLAINTTGEELDKYPVFTAADATGMSLADAMELANTKWEAISEGGKPALQEFFPKWLEKGAWDEAWAAQLTNINPA